jgi:putative tricarboxylic transport membrane protein
VEKNESIMKQRNLVSGIILLALAIATLVETNKLEIGTLLSPQTGFFPFILAILLGILSLILLGQAITEKDERKVPSWVSSGGWKTLSLTLGGLLFFAIFFERLGYLVSTFLLISLLVGAIGKRKWWLVILFAFLSTLISYLIFGILLKTELPAGIMGD